ncbi:MAG: cell division protein FtsB [Azoarcus sp.]|jgi:cell division protein FtsB|nr:cell division protein FtsB [Azoarcus sp.]
MRWPIAILVVLVVVLQYPLWLGRGGWLRAWEIEKDLQAQRGRNRALEDRNASLDAEMGDLQTGAEAVEERARYDLGLVRPGEIFVQVPRAPAPPPKILKPGQEPAPDDPHRR